MEVVRRRKKEEEREEEKNTDKKQKTERRARIDIGERDILLLKLINEEGYLSSANCALVFGLSIASAKKRLQRLRQLMAVRSEQFFNLLLWRLDEVGAYYVDVFYPGHIGMNPAIYLHKEEIARTRIKYMKEAKLDSTAERVLWRQRYEKTIRHVPDYLLHTADGDLPVEIELSMKKSKRYEQIIGNMVRDGRREVLYIARATIAGQLRTSLRAAAAKYHGDITVYVSELDSDKYLELSYEAIN